MSWDIEKLDQTQAWADVLVWGLWLRDSWHCQRPVGRDATCKLITLWGEQGRDLPLAQVENIGFHEKINHKSWQGGERVVLRFLLKSG